MAFLGFADPPQVSTHAPAITAPNPPLSILHMYLYMHRLTNRPVTCDMQCTTSGRLTPLLLACLWGCKAAWAGSLPCWLRQPCCCTQLTATCLQCGRVCQQGSEFVWVGGWRIRSDSQGAATEQGVSGRAGSGKQIASLEREKRQQAGCTIAAAGREATRLHASMPHTCKG